MPQTEITLEANSIKFVDKIIDGQATVVVEVIGDGEQRDDEAPASTGYMLVATVFEMFKDGTLFAEMQRRFDHEALVKIEEKT